MRKPRVPDGMVEIRLRIDPGPRFHNHRDLKRGDVVTIPRADAIRYFKTGIAQAADAGELRPAYWPYVDPRYTE